MHFCFFKSHQLISGSDRTEVHLAKESRKSTIFDRELVSRGLKKTGLFQTKFNFGHECPQYFIPYKNLYTPKLFLFLHFLILDFLSFPPFLILSSTFFLSRFYIIYIILGVTFFSTNLLFPIFIGTFVSLFNLDFYFFFGLLFPFLQKSRSELGFLPSIFF